VTAAERYITLTIGIITIITILLRIAWTTGRLMQQFGDHLKNSERVHQDIETRVRKIEQQPGQGQRRERR
jgi:flagellar biogenesis protein FliO